MNSVEKKIAESNKLINDLLNGKMESVNCDSPDAVPSEDTIIVLWSGFVF
jgi:hypothetical protein